MTKKSYEVAWLIERPGVDGPEWFFARDKGDGVSAFGWSNDSTEAVKFETQSEADAWRRKLASIIPALISNETTVTEHAWINPREKTPVRL